MKKRLAGALGVMVIVALAACTPGTAPTSSPGPTGTTPAGTATPGSLGTIKIGVDLPLSGADAQNGQPTLKGVQLLIDEINAAGGIEGYMLALSIQDHTRDGRFNPDQGAANMRVLVNDASVVASIGPYNSSVARVQIPISNEAGMLQCSPANTAEDLTKPEFGGLTLRPAFPDRIAYIRIATTDDVQGPAGASYAYNDLGLRNMLVVDDTTTFGEGVADNFQAEFERLGGTVAQRVGAQPTTTNFIPILDAAPEGIDGAYYGGVTSSGGGLMRKQMPQAGLGDLPFVGPDGIQDGPGSAATSFIGIAQEAAANSFSTIAAIGDFPGKVEFEQRFATRFANDAEFKTAGPYSGPAYACGQVITKSIEEALKAGANPSDGAAFREAVRAWATDPMHRFTSVVGEIGFDANGDNTAKFISFYKSDMTADNGNGAWVFEKQQNFGQ